MSEESQDEQIEERIDRLEEQVEELSFNSVEQRILSIEDEQSQLRDDLDELVHSIREQGEETPHIDSVENLHERLVALETGIGGLRKELEEFLEDE